ncbi:hypothetical protein ILUMI_09374 [Ignelater luminosus]|uniref:Sas10 C-terminal domain-containing protein n=1 Tax=Ignelater luminosus TaxID=2038154 RepID=A0A8K0D5W7_IGNLU|nr:hypothetical protein ILUMI_09374 [Ignelater luminosus]
MSATHIRFNEDDEYEPTDSEEEGYTEHQKGLLKRARNRQEQQSESEEEVYGVHSDTSSDIALSDVEGQGGEDDLPDVRAWGKDKKHYYSTDYVDPDYGGYQGKDAALADLEEEEARNLQKQLMQQLDDDDFSLDLVSKSVKTEDKRQAEEVVKTDISKLTKRQKIDLLIKESPEFFSLVEDFKNKMELARDFLFPILELSRNNRIKECEALDFIKTYYEVILNYSTNINMYLLLKASRINIQSHPVIKRLYQYRQLLAQLDPVFEETIKSQIEILIETFKSEENDEDFNKKKTLKVLRKSLKKVRSSISEDENVEPPQKKSKKSSKEEIKSDLSNNKKSKNVQFDPVVEQTEYNVEDEQSDKEENVDDIEGDSRRGITYQIAKNKGLTPHRNKLQRNPRVKHRNKYRQAKIRRKGAIREVRTEMSRYAGELSGIKTSVTKSIKIKS